MLKQLKNWVEKKTNLQKKFNKDWNELHSIRVQSWERYEDTKTVSDKGTDIQDNVMPDYQRILKA